MRLLIPTAGIEPELLAPTPRRIRLRNWWWLSLRVVVLGAVLLPLLALTAWIGWELLLTMVGTPVTVSVMERRFDSTGYWVRVSWPRRAWDGHVEEATRELSVGADYYKVTPGRLLPALRVGRGSLQLLDVQMNGRARDVGESAVPLGLLLPFDLAGLALMLGGALRDRWLLKWGRPVRGVVRARTKSNNRECTILYEYWELGQPGSSVTHRGRRVVTSAQFEQTNVGQGVTVVHSLWDPRRHVPYSLLPHA